MKTTWCMMTLGRDRGLGLPRVRLAFRGLAMVFPGPAFAATTGAPEPAAVGRTLLQELNLPAIWFLVACSVLIVWLVVDLYLRSARRELLPGAVVAAVRAAFRRGDFQAGYDACAQRSGLFANAMAAALRHASEGRTASEDAAAVALEAGQARLQSRIAYLSVIGVIAPMVGLTGTVLGMIDAFAAMGQPGAADPARLSGAIGHVLHATAGGLIVAIPAFVLHYVLRSRVALAVRAVAEEVHELFRGFPYACREGVDFRGAERCVPVGGGGRAAGLAESNP